MKRGDTRRYWKLNSTSISLSDGIDPPAHVINPDYKEQPRIPRKCGNCGKIHDLILEDTMTGDRLHEFDKCKKCIMEKWFESNSD